MTNPNVPVHLDAGGGLVIVLNDTWDAYGFWSATAIPDGWFGDNVKQTVLEPSGADGDVLGENRKKGRSLVVKGFAGAADLPGWFTAANRLEAVTSALVAGGTLTVDEPTGAKHLAVYYSPGGLGVALSGMMRFTGPTREVHVGFNFQVPLLAPVPTKT